jgi:hypothetical protein
MIVLNDLCGDEDDTHIVCEVLKELLHRSIYEALSRPQPTVQDMVAQMESQYRTILLDNVHIPNYDPQVKCEMLEDRVMKVNFLCPQWVVDTINEEG